jgi:hypothetical protein
MSGVAGIVLRGDHHRETDNPSLTRQSEPICRLRQDGAGRGISSKPSRRQENVSSAMKEAPS